MLHIEKNLFRAIFKIKQKLFDCRFFKILIK